jgi:hypothetical protein
MIISPLNREAIDEVFEDLSEAERENMRRLNVSEETIKQGFIDHIGKPFGGAFYDKDRNCCALVRLKSLGELNFKGYFVDRANRMTRIAFPFTRLMARLSDKIKADGGSIQLLSYCSDSKMSRWIKSMGFVKTGEDANTKHTIFLKGGN